MLSCLHLLQASGTGALALNREWWATSGLKVQRKLGIQEFAWGRGVSPDVALPYGRVS